MNKGYIKFKNRRRIGAVIQALIIGTAMGIIVLSIPILFSKLGSIPLKSPTYIIITIASALLTSGIFLLLTYPTDKRLAKKLDRSLKLNEKVQTMIAFKDVDGEMINIQRSDTDRILENTPTKKVKSRLFPLNFVLPVLAAVCLTTAILIPAKASEQPPPAVDPGYNLSAWQEQALKDLINDVKKSDMDSSPKNDIVTALEGLLTQLKNAKKESEMKTSVINVIKIIYQTVHDYNTYDIISEKLKSAESDSIKTLGTSIETLDALALSKDMTAIKEALLQSDTKNALGTLVSALDSALKNPKVSSDDRLLLALSSFSASLAEIHSSMDTYTDDALKEKLDAAFQSAEEALGSVMHQQYTNEKVGDDAILRLMNIFQITENDIPAEMVPEFNSNNNEEDSYRPDDDNPLNSGGLGSGEMIYGSNDTIYDPELNEYVTYGDVINRYYAKITEQFVDGNIPEDLEQMISDYFASLFNGSKN